MAADRIVVGATADDDLARAAARRLRDEGHEIVFVGGHQTPEQLVRTAVAEDVVRLVVDADVRTLAYIADLCGELDATDIRVEPAM
jgi:methylmalonyl-CoA mutase C-terminal domain/subunit